jgi:hypothetical protein
LEELLWTQELRRAMGKKPRLRDRIEYLCVLRSLSPIWILTLFAYTVCCSVRVVFLSQKHWRPCWIQRDFEGQGTVPTQNRYSCSHLCALLFETLFVISYKPVTPWQSNCQVAPGRAPLNCGESGPVLLDSYFARRPHRPSPVTGNSERKSR